MLPSLPISRLIAVSINLTPIAAQSQNLSTLLILGSSDIIDVQERFRSYSTIAEVASDFPTNSPEYLAAVLWFEQAPQPTAIDIGRWAKIDTKAKINGGLLSAVQQAMAAWSAVVTPGFEVEVNGLPKAFAPASFATATNLNGVATLIQTALAAQVANTTCKWNSIEQRFEIEDGVTGAVSTLSFLNPPTAVGTFTFNAQPVDTDKITLNGTDVVFASPASAGKVTVGSDLAHTLANLMAFLAASVDANILDFKYFLSGSVLGVKAATPGVGGNALTTTRSWVTPGNCTVSGATLAGGSATDVSTMLGMTSVFSGAYVAQGLAAEAALDAVTVFDNQFGQRWYGLTIPEAVDTDHLAVAAYIEASNNKHFHGVSSQEAGILSSVSTTDIAYLLKQAKYNKTAVQYSSSNPYSAASLLGRALTVDYNGNNTVITLMYKQEPGITAENIATAQLNALEGKNCNVFIQYNNDTAILEQGKVSSGAFIDEITGADWLAVTVMTGLYNLLYTSPTKIPQTDAGTHLLATTIEAICSQAVINGLLAPGVWNSAGFGTLKQGDFMPKGFYVFVPLVASQLQADREARKSVTIQVAAKLAGAVHTVDVIISVNR